MITNSTIGNHGRLGNVLFQYAALKALAKKINCQAKIPPDLNDRICDGQKCLLNYFNIDCDAYSEDELSKLGKRSEMCPGGHYSTEIWNSPINSDICGWFESELYFENIKDDIRKEYQLKPEIDNYANNYISDIRNKYPGCQIIGLHFRRGDYMRGYYKICTNEWNIEYFNKAFHIFDNTNNCILLIFTGGSTDIGNSNSDDMKWCKQFMGTSTGTIYSENHDTIHDFALMTKCDHLIANSSSTIIWWAGYLNENKNKRIIVPTNMHMKSETTFWYESFIKIDTDFIPDNFIKIGIRFKKNIDTCTNICTNTYEQERLREFIKNNYIKDEHHDPITVIFSESAISELFPESSTCAPDYETERNIRSFIEAINHFHNIEQKVFIIYSGGSIEYGNYISENIEWCVEYFKTKKIPHIINHDIICDSDLEYMVDHLIVK